MSAAAPLALPAPHRRLLLHTCCAPCSGDVMERLVQAGIDYTLFFFNPNIHPRREYLLRKDENVRFAEALGVPLVDADYDPGAWFERAAGMEDDPERGRRCSMCFAHRFAETAAYASANGFDLISSTLGISRWKDFEQVTRAGVAAAAAHPGVRYWTTNWRKGGGAARMLTVSRREQFYQQEYCGCAYSLRDTNRARRERGRLPIQLGVRHYGRDRGA